MTDTSLVSSEARSQGSARDRNCSVLAPATVDDFTSTFLNVKALIPGCFEVLYQGRLCVLCLSGLSGGPAGAGLLTPCLVGTELVVIVPPGTPVVAPDSTQPQWALLMAHPKGQPLSTLLQQASQQAAQGLFSSCYSDTQAVQWCTEMAAALQALHSQTMPTQNLVLDVSAVYLEPSPNSSSLSSATELKPALACKGISPGGLVLNRAAAHSAPDFPAPGAQAGASPLLRSLSNSFASSSEQLQEPGQACAAPQPGGPLSPPRSTSPQGSSGSGTRRVPSRKPSRLALSSAPGDQVGAGWDQRRPSFLRQSTPALALDVGAAEAEASDGPGLVKWKSSTHAVLAEAAAELAGASTTAPGMLPERRPPPRRSSSRLAISSVPADVTQQPLSQDGSEKEGAVLAPRKSSTQVLQEEVAGEHWVVGTAPPGHLPERRPPPRRSSSRLAIASLPADAVQQNSQGGDAEKEALGLVQRKSSAQLLQAEVAGEHWVVGTAAPGHLPERRPPPRRSSSRLAIASVPADITNQGLAQEDTEKEALGLVQRKSSTQALQEEVAGEHWVVGTAPPGHLPERRPPPRRSSSRLAISSHGGGPQVECPAASAAVVAANGQVLEDEHTVAPTLAPSQLADQSRATERRPVRRASSRLSLSSDARQGSDPGAATAAGARPGSGQHSPPSRAASFSSGHSPARSNGGTASPVGAALHAPTLSVGGAEQLVARALSHNNGSRGASPTRGASALSPRSSHSQGADDTPPHPHPHAHSQSQPQQFPGRTQPISAAPGSALEGVAAVMGRRAPSRRASRLSMISCPNMDVPTNACGADGFAATAAEVPAATGAGSAPGERPLAQLPAAAAAAAADFLGLGANGAAAATAHASWGAGLSRFVPEPSNSGSCRADRLEDLELDEEGGAPLLRRVLSRSCSSRSLASRLHATGMSTTFLSQIHGDMLLGTAQELAAAATAALASSAPQVETPAPVRVPAREAVQQQQKAGAGAAGAAEAEEGGEGSAAPAPRSAATTALLMRTTSGKELAAAEGLLDEENADMVGASSLGAALAPARLPERRAPPRRNSSRLSLTSGTAGSEPAAPAAGSDAANSGAAAQAQQAGNGQAHGQEASEKEALGLVQRKSSAQLLQAEVAGEHWVVGTAAPGHLPVRRPPVKRSSSRLSSSTISKGQDIMMGTYPCLDASSGSAAVAGIALAQPLQRSISTSSSHTSGANASDPGAASQAAPGSGSAGACAQPQEEGVETLPVATPDVVRRLPGRRASRLAVTTSPADTVGGTTQQRQASINAAAEGLLLQRNPQLAVAAAAGGGAAIVAAAATGEGVALSSSHRSSRSTSDSGSSTGRGVRRSPSFTAVRALAGGTPNPVLSVVGSAVHGVGGGPAEGGALLGAALAPAKLPSRRSAPRRASSRLSLSNVNVDLQGANVDENGSNQGQQGEQDLSRKTGSGPPSLQPGGPAAAPSAGAAGAGATGLPDAAAPARDAAADVLAFGLILYQVLTRTLIEEVAGAAAEGALAEKLASGWRPPQAPAKGQAIQDGALWQLCCDCWAVDPAARPSIDEVAKRLESVQVQAQAALQVASTLSPVTSNRLEEAVAQELQQQVTAAAEAAPAEAAATSRGPEAGFSAPAVAEQEVSAASAGTVAGPGKARAKAEASTAGAGAAKKASQPGCAACTIM